MKTNIERIAALEQAVRELEDWRDQRTGAIDVATGRRHPERLNRFRGVPMTAGEIDAIAEQMVAPVCDRSDYATPLSSPSPAQTPRETDQEPTPPGDLAHRLTVHLAEFSDLRHGMLTPGAFRVLVEQRIACFLRDVEGTDVEVGETTSGRVHLTIPDGNVIRLDVAQAKRVRENLDRVILKIEGRQT